MFNLDSLDSFTRGYIGAALWSTNDDNGDPFDQNHSEEDFADETIAKIVADCISFQEKAGDLISDENLLRRPDHNTASSFGHDFWLTRNGHGAGFWDGDYAKPADAILTKLAKSFRSVDLEVGDDGKIYLQGC